MPGVLSWPPNDRLIRTLVCKHISLDLPAESRVSEKEIADLQNQTVISEVEAGKDCVLVSKVS